MSSNPPLMWVAACRRYDLIGEFRAIDGLKVGDEVRVAGVKVGTVTRAVLRTNDYVAVVTRATSTGS